VEISILRGTWSEVERVREERLVFGGVASQDKLMKARSSLSSVGIARLLDQVKLLSRRGSSIRQGSWITSLKASASEIWKLELFFSEAYRIMLKSPQTNQGVLVGGARLLNSARKEGRRSGEAGA